MSNIEVDHFGPWVIEISEDDPSPLLFLPYLTRQEEPLLSIKIPRNIEHRHARPGMNLYDYLVSLYRHDLVILQRSGDTVIEHTYQYQDIQYLSHGENLLQGNLRLGLRDAIVDLPFNTVSSREMERLAALIRERYCTVPDVVPVVEELPTPVEGLSFYFNGLLIKRDMVEPQFCLLAAQTNTPVASPEPASLNELFFRVVGKTLLESIHFSDGRELKIVTRGQDYKYKWEAVYAKEYTYVPLENINGFRWQSNTRHTAVCRLLINTPAGPLSFVFTNDNAYIPIYSEFLEAVSSSFNRKEAFTLQQLNRI